MKSDWYLQPVLLVCCLTTYLCTVYHAPWYWKEREVMIASLLCRNKNLESASGHHPLFAQEKAGGSRLPALIQKTYTFMFFSCSLFLQQCVFLLLYMCVCVSKWGCCLGQPHTDINPPNVLNAEININHAKNNNCYTLFQSPLKHIRNSYCQHAAVVTPTHTWNINKYR